MHPLLRRLIKLTDQLAEMNKRCTRYNLQLQKLLHSAIAETFLCEIEIIAMLLYSH